MVSANTGLCFQLVIPKSIPEFEALFLKGEPDIVFLNPYHQVMANEAQGYMPMLADNKPLTGIIVVRRDSTVQGIKDLNKQTIAFPAPNAFAASLLLRAILTESKIDFRAQYVQTHSNVYRTVAAGTVVAGGGVNNTLAREPLALREELRVLYESPGFRSHPVSAHPRVPPKVRQAFSNAIFQLARSEEGKKLLNQVQLPDPTPATHREDYAPLERLGVQRFVTSDN
jgi:phosphonate transport system substrate-binding protein